MFQMGLRDVILFKLFWPFFSVESLSVLAFSAISYQLFWHLSGSAFANEILFGLWCMAAPMAYVTAQAERHDW